METAVSWLIDRIEDVDLTEEMFESIKQQAKEMEKQQIANLLEWIRLNAIEVIDGWQCGDEKYTDSELIELYQHL